MADQKPTRTAGDEREAITTLLQYQRESLVRKVTGLDHTSAGERFVDSGTTLLWLLQHLAQAEVTWVVVRFAGLDEPLPEPAPTLEGAIATYRSTWARVDGIVAAADLDDLCRAPGEGPPVDLRWVLLHLLEETARHAGHADIIRELMDGETGR